MTLRFVDVCAAIFKTLSIFKYYLLKQDNSFKAHAAFLSCNDIIRDSSFIGEYIPLHQSRLGFTSKTNIILSLNFDRKLKTL